ncbi:MAG: 30S ribosomal protein S8e, partial [Candidatus Micrarchaeota archaeon]|nr:30S ribosomal protein S8e [Candidatus Micrarchaeota archaeon]
IEAVVQGNTPNDTRAGIITKGTIIRAKGYGEAVITSRPNQSGILNAKLL